MTDKTENVNGNYGILSRGLRDAYKTEIGNVPPKLSDLWRTFLKQKASTKTN